MIKEANATIMVKDMERAIRFYVDVLGLKQKARYGDHFAQVGAPGTIIALHPTSNTTRSAVQGEISIGFSVDDLEATMRELKAKGVQFSRTTDDAQVKLAFFTDPDGNPLYLSQNKWG